jgi:hypothetical protein
MKSIQSPHDRERAQRVACRAGPAEEPDTLYLGADPGVLFRSGDAGETWEPNHGILEHRTRDRWLPGAGGLCCHSIELDPSDPGRMYVGITSAGTFRTDDGGATWMPLNKNVAGDFLPDPYADVGQCVHKLLLHPARPERLWQQNHCGVYRSDDRGDSWERLDANGLPSGFGFPIMLDPKEPDTAFVIPEVRMEYHYTPHERLGVYRTRDAGQTWELMSDGLRSQRGRPCCAKPPPSPGLRLLRHPERLLLRTRRGRQVGRRCTAPSADPVHGGRRVVQVVVPSILAAQAEGPKRFDVEADTVSASNTGSITSFTAAPTTRPRTAGIESGRSSSRPGFGMNTRRAGSGRQRPSRRSAASSSSRRETPYCSTSTMVCRSMPAAPLLARTSPHARAPTTRPSLRPCRRARGIVARDRPWPPGKAFAAVLGPCPARWPLVT